ncbi:hypothetical protein MOJ76_16370 [Bacillus haynesii]|uniref:hypothetical protein n=1 Tax=Bacillus haynesii TaxID=1925021 RepID=UPI00227EECFE|nr:hypothetical protein [Bacillus haynesii]MCY8009857.1 hypothetical protein [Bacillus haynesii]
MINISKLYILLGNGFSIDIVQRLEKKFPELEGEINLINLFNKGGEVPWPKTTHNGFLSYQYCSSLWTLGARTTLTNEQTNELIEDIITCVNVYNYSKLNNIEQHQQNFQYENSNIYLSAYNELTTYLRYLMIHYNSKIKDKDLSQLDIPLITYLKDQYNQYEEINIITYNYDILLERLLILNELNFNISGFEHKDTKINIIKPHGSISFSSNLTLNTSSPFTVKDAMSSVSQECSQFEIKYKFENDFPIVNPIIPPAGDSTRTDIGWVKNLRKIINDKLNQSSSRDKLIIFGLSYSHVDRQEVDEIITKIDPLVQVTLINPNPPTTLDAVLTSVFKNYIHYTKSEFLHLKNSNYEHNKATIMEVQS